MVIAVIRFRTTDNIRTGSVSAVAVRLTAISFFLADRNIEKAVYILKAVMNTLIREKLSANKVSHINELVHSVMNRCLALFAYRFQSVIQRIPH